MAENRTAELPEVGYKVPIFFTFRNTVFGNGFAAEVCAQYGRALGVVESDGVWLYGINPGGMAAHGADPDDVHRAFRHTFSNILVDLAAEARNFAEFAAAVRSFFDETNEGYVADWAEAVVAVRQGDVQAPTLKRVNADSQRSITVSEKHDFTAADNRPKLRATMAA